jgi:prephenate dehydrogenase
MPPVALVVVAVPPSRTAAVVGAVLATHPEAVVTDVASVKAPVLAGLAGPPGLGRYVGGHPMAGREVSGPQAARADLFDDRPWVICGHPGNTEHSLAVVRALVRDTRALPIELDPQAHDRAVALISHVPQVVASLLAAQLVAAPADAVAIAGQGLRDMTRIAASDPGLWTQILTANSGPVADVLGGLRADLDVVLAALQAAQQGPVTAALVAGNAGRNRGPGKHGAAAQETAVLPVLVSDRPGELSRLFAAVDAAGVNVEDARIEHVLGRPTGVVELSVPARHGPRLANSLRSAGWSVRG